MPCTTSRTGWTSVGGGPAAAVAAAARRGIRSFQAMGHLRMSGFSKALYVLRPRWLQRGGHSPTLCRPGDAPRGVSTVGKLPLLPFRGTLSAAATPRRESPVRPPRNVFRFSFQRARARPRTSFPARRASFSRLRAARQTQRVSFPALQAASSSLRGPFPRGKEARSPLLIPFPALRVFRRARRGPFPAARVIRRAGMRLEQLFASCTSDAIWHFVEGMLHEGGGMRHSLLFASHFP